jgi:hypothetical protein
MPASEKPSHQRTNTPPHADASNSARRRNPTQHVPEDAVLYLKCSWTLPPDVRFDG